MSEYAQLKVIVLRIQQWLLFYFVEQKWHEYRCYYPTIRAE